MSSSSMQRNFFVLASVLALAIPFALLLFAGKAGTPEEELNAREAVFRHQLTHKESAFNDIDTFCVEITRPSDTWESSRLDPPRRMIERLNDGRYRVRKGSDCEYNDGNGVVEKISRKPALVLRAGGISWKSSTRVAITGGYYYASEGASGNVYHLEKRGGKWLVTEDRLLWLS